MNEKEFCYWLKSAFELSDIKSFNEKQTKLIKEHLDLVFNKVTSPDVTQYPFAYPLYPHGPQDPMLGLEKTCTGLPQEFNLPQEFDCANIPEAAINPLTTPNIGGSSAGDIKYCTPIGSC